MAPSAVTAVQLSHGETHCVPPRDTNLGSWAANRQGLRFILITNDLINCSPGRRGAGCWGRLWCSTFPKPSWSIDEKGNRTWRFSLEKILRGSRMLSCLPSALLRAPAEAWGLAWWATGPHCSELVTLTLPLVAVTDAAAATPASLKPCPTCPAFCR